MTRYTKADVRSIVNQFDVEAKQVGLLPLDHKLVYNAGSSTNGVTATVMVQGPEGRYVSGLDRFVPEFNWKMTSTDQFRLIEAAVNVLYALRIQREAAAKYFR